MDKKELIIKKAKELIARFGFKKTTMEDIARASRMGKATLYYYFKSKEDILREIIEVEGENLRKILENAVKKGKTAKEKLRLYAIARFRFLQELGLYYSTIKDEIYAHLDFIEKERQKFDSFDFGMLKDILEEGVKKGEFKPIDTSYYAFLLLKGIRGLEYPVVLGQSFSFEDRKVDLEYAINVFLDMLFYGIATR